MSSFVRARPVSFERLSFHVGVGGTRGASCVAVAERLNAGEKVAVNEGVPARIGTTVEVARVTTLVADCGVIVLGVKLQATTEARKHAVAATLVVLFIYFPLALTASLPMTTTAELGGLFPLAQCRFCFNQAPNNGWLFPSRGSCGDGRYCPRNNADRCG